MNIFILDEHPGIAAAQYCDRHVSKLIVELAQMLSTARRLLDDHTADNDDLYKITHKNHPATIWVRESHKNYIWAYRHFEALCLEYTCRYGKIHGTQKKLMNRLWRYPSYIPMGDLTPFPQCMPDQYKVPGNAVKAYQNYYIGEKAAFAKWAHSPTPYWWPKN